MSLLLDTHAGLWLWGDDPRLSAGARAAIAGAERVVWGVASSWEVAIQSALGRLDLPTPLDTFITMQLRLNGFELLPVLHHHACAVACMPLLHRDPFDRLLVAQAQAEGLSLVTVDAAATAYGVPVVW